MNVGSSISIPRTLLLLLSPDIATTSTSREKTAVHGCHIATANNVFVLPPYHASVGIPSNLT